MTVLDFRTLTLSKSIGRTTLTADADLYERIFTALKRVATDTIPLVLLKEVLSGENISFPILRKIDSYVYVRMPNRIETEDSRIDIDETLLDAVALYVMAGLERANAKTYMGLYYRELEMNNDRLIETSLIDSSNECADRFKVFP